MVILPLIVIYWQYSIALFNFVLHPHCISYCVSMILIIARILCAHLTTHFWIYKKKTYMSWTWYINTNTHRVFERRETLCVSMSLFAYIKFIISCYRMLYWTKSQIIVKQQVSFNKKCLSIKKKEDNATGTTYSHFICVTHDFHEIQCGFQLIGRSLSDKKSLLCRFS